MFQYRRTQDGGLQVYLVAANDFGDEDTVTETPLLTLNEAQANALVVTYLRGPMGPPGPIGPMGVSGRDAGENVL